MVLETVVDWGVSGEGGSVLHIDCLLLDKPAPAGEPLAAPSPEMTTFNIQTPPDEMSWANLIKTKRT